MEWFVVVPDECRNQFGPRAEGKACMYGSQCETGMCGLTDPAAMCGTCTPRRAEGEACGDGYACAYDLDCVDSVCTKLGRLGDSCDRGEAACNNAQSIACYLEQDAATGTCQLLPGLGELCSGPVCRAELSCNLTSGSCVPDKMGTLGGACGYDAEDVYTWCPGGSYCDTNSVCVAKASTGEACPTGVRCRPGNRCLNAVCTVPDPTACNAEPAPEGAEGRGLGREPMPRTSPFSPSKREFFRQRGLLDPVLAN
jgi:hypothetical protein